MRWLQLLAFLALGLAAGTGCRPAATKPNGSGTIECTQAQAAPQVAGRLLKLIPHEGDVVKKGEVIAQIDSKDYELRRDEARAGVALSQAQLDLMLAGSREEDIQKAREQLREAEALAQAAVADFERVRQVFEKKSATQKQFDDAQAQRDRTAAAVAGAKQSLARLVAGNRKEDIHLAETQVAVAKVKQAQAEKAVADCVVTAPMDGTVTIRSREDGEMVSVGTPLITVSRVDEVWLSVYVPEPQLGRVKLGQTASVKADGIDSMFTGKITFVSPEAEFTPRNAQTPDERAKLVFRVKITLSNTNGIFKPGMPADAYLEGSPALVKSDGKGK